MPRVKKSESTPAETKPTVEKKVSKKEKVAATPATQEVVTPPATQEVSTSSQETATSNEFTDFMTKLQQLSAMIHTLKGEFRSIEKKAIRDMKNVEKANAKRKKKNVNRAPSGFVKPTPITQELASFLGKSAGTEMARTEVTREINAYIRENKLQDKSNGRIINADTKLSALLKIPTGQELTYFNLQRYMSPHFIKTAPVATA